MSAPVVIEEEKLVTAPLRSTLFYLSLPVLFEQLLNFGVGFVDTWLSGQLSAAATSAIGFGSYVGWLAWMLFSIVSVGTTALVSRAWGARKQEEAREITNSALALSLVSGVIIGVVIILIARPISMALNHSPEALEATVNYIRGIALCFPAFCFITVSSAALRGAGFMQTPMWVMVIVNILNVIFSPSLVFGWGPFPALGINGIIIGTVLAEYFGALFMFLIFWKGRGTLQLRFSEWQVMGDIPRRIVRIGLPAVWDGIFTWVGQYIFLFIISQLAMGDIGTAIFAAHIIGVKLEGISYLTATAWGQAAATMVGQSLGADKIERARQAGHEAALQCCLPVLMTSFLFYLGSEEIYQWMHEDPLVVQAGAGAFKVLAWFQIPLVTSIIYVCALRGAGETRRPFWINMLGIFGVRIPLAWLLGIYYDGGLIGAWIGMCVDTAFRALLIWAYYVWGPWDRTEV
ncbi:Multidrug resistance protein NorM [Polystyrenella longa]|uniref:Multidrug-efflux transporter n=1 Tax=Polystyrenella longa TaxID=2528007 RepID=A0A518CJ61_9PLAN|nr:MATE family efflux transporter [Polystyrenella longa]QDU79262.1 Multidrug resistance protein NorM [Polystyrenella longa]